MAPHTGRQFKNVFAEANQHLRSTFGMEMTELPQKEKVTISQKRAAQRSQTSGSSSTRSYILTSTLPSSLRIPPILPPPQVPVSSAESAYVGFYTFVISLIYLSPGGSIAETRLEKHLQRMNADNFVLGEKVEKVLKKLEREGYIIKVRERDGGGEESVDYIVGPRGKAEIGERGAAGLVRSVYGKRDVEKDELERRLVRSLGDMVVQKKNVRAEEEETPPDGAEAERGGVEVGERRRSTRGMKAKPARPTERRRGRSAVAQDEGESEDGEDEEAEEDDE